MDLDPAGGSPVMLVMLVRARQLDLERSIVAGRLTQSLPYRFSYQVLF